MKAQFNIVGCKIIDQWKFQGHSCMIEQDREDGGYWHTVDGKTVLSISSRDRSRETVQDWIGANLPY